MSISSIPPQKRATMTLYSGVNDPLSHRVRLVLAEKSISYDLIEINDNTADEKDLENKENEKGDNKKGDEDKKDIEGKNHSKNSKAKEEFNQLNPYGTPPLLVDRELVLYHSSIIMEYLEERFPHPSLMPAYPVARARCRLMMYRVDRDWYTLMDKILACKSGILHSETEHSLKELRKELREGLTSIAPIFSELPYFLSEEFSLIDCCMAPLLWRLPQLGITLPEQAQSVIGYAERLFSRNSFTTSLTETEVLLHQTYLRELK